MFSPPTWLEISTSAIHHNITQFKRIIGTNDLALIVKSNAYGHGMHEIASIVQDMPEVSWLGVAALSDAESLRKKGITKPIMVTSCIDRPIQTALDHGIDLAVYDIDTLKILNEMGVAHNTKFNIHIKFDTGLSRLGFYPEEASEILSSACAMPGITVNGIYSHFAESYKPDQTYTRQQVQAFDQIIEQAKPYAISYKHLANTAGTLLFDLAQCNLFRIGLGIYGYWANPDIQKRVTEKYPDFVLKGALTWKARINSIKKVPAHAYIGYDRTYQTTRPTMIATIPVGYYDGYDFRLFNKSHVLIRNTYAPIVGRISMNLATIDVSDIPNVALADEVILMGNFPLLTPYELGSLLGTPNVREITTKINAAIPRIIVD